MVTESTGLAVVRGLKTNQVPGKLQIYVTASYRGLRARTLITQFIEGPAVARGGGGKIVAVWRLWAPRPPEARSWLLERRHNPAKPWAAVTPPPPPIGITPGTPGISPPR